LLYITLNPIVGVAYRKIESISGASGAGKQQQQEQIQLREDAWRRLDGQDVFRVSCKRATWEKLWRHSTLVFFLGLPNSLQHMMDIVSKILLPVAVSFVIM